ncbi:carbohydrate esterase family 16 protein [Corynascus similis CBS 632.67]
MGRFLTSTTLALFAAAGARAAAFPRARNGTTPSVKYLISFGDSYSQTGFDVTSTKPSADNPLGNPPLPGWTASGGLNWVGFLVSEFNTSTTLSYNFAAGGATTNATIVPPYQSTVLSFIDQVAQFSDSIASKPDYAPWSADNALFGIWMGVNDAGNVWWDPEYDSLVEEIMASYFGQLQILYDAGARNFALLSVPPIHRTPAVVLANTPEQQELEAESIQKYNDALAANLEAFTEKNDGITAKIVDTTVPFNTALDNPEEYGSPDATCYNSDGVSCLWFNDYHPGVEINRLVAQAFAEAWEGSFF